jgi:energy-converting hydrogenase B subunit J
MISLGPIIFGIILGLIIGSQIKLNVSDAKFTLSSFVVILIAGIIVAWQLGEFPFYASSLLSSAFLSALIGIFIGVLLFGRRK